MKNNALVSKNFFCRTKWFPVIMSIACSLQIYGQTGNTLQNPIAAGSFGFDFWYENTQNTVNFTNNYSGRPSNDVFYKFTLNAPMYITISHCGSALSDTYVHLLDAAGNRIAYNDDYNREGACSNIYHSFIKTTLLQGIYYIVSEGYSQNGSIRTTIEGKEAPIFYSYYYDAAGNRVKREYQNPMPQFRAAQDETIAKIEKPEKTDYDVKIAVIPNPTQGPATVKISGDMDLSQITIRVFDEKGTAIFSRKPSSAQTDIDLSAHPAGIYMFRIYVDENIIVKKIIKK